MLYEEDELAELHFGNVLEREWIVIGIKDIVEATCGTERSLLREALISLGWTPPEETQTNKENS